MDRRTVAVTPSERRMIRSTPEAAWRALALVRLMVGAVFVSEGLQKFLFPADVGAGRFARIGFESPEMLAAVVGVAEISFGGLVLVGLLTRQAAAGLALVMAGALLTTKLPILLGHDLGPFAVRALDRYGFWAMVHEMRTDWAMLLGSLVLVWAGSGPWSLDDALRRRVRVVRPEDTVPLDPPDAHEPIGPEAAGP